MVSEAAKERRTKLITNRSRAKEMRHKPVATEKLFWSCVRNRQLAGHKFKRQVPIGCYIVDFVCLERRLIVELDGVLHRDRVDYDAARDLYLKRQGYGVLRFTNEDFAGDIATILRTIQFALDTGTPSPQPSPPSGERG